MPKTRKEFSPEFKREAVALLESSGRPLTGGDRGGYLATDVAELADGSSWRDRAIAGDGATGSVADAIASGPGVSSC